MSSAGVDIPAKGSCESSSSSQGSNSIERQHNKELEKQYVLVERPSKQHLSQSNGFGVCKRLSVSATHEYPPIFEVVSPHFEEPDQYFISSKVVFLGDSGVGKSSILARFTQRMSIYGPSNDQASSATLTPQFSRKTQTIYKLGSHQIQFNMWDTAGQHKYRCLSQIYLRDATVAVIVFDLTERNTFEAVDQWSETVRQQRVIEEDDEEESGIPMIVLVGNKCDKRSLIRVTEEEARDKAKSIGASLYFECTCMSELSTQELFQKVGTEMFRRRELDKVPDERQYSCQQVNVRSQKATM